VSELRRYEPSIQIGATAAEAYLSAASGSQSEYSVTAKATDGDEFTNQQGMGAGGYPANVRARC
jgi:hypothetical protein